MPILKYIPMKDWTEDEHHISQTLTKSQDVDQCYVSLATIKTENRYYLIVEQQDRFYLNILNRRFFFSICSLFSLYGVGIS